MQVPAQLIFDWNYSDCSVGKAAALPSEESDSSFTNLYINWFICVFIVLCHITFWDWLRLNLITTYLFNQSITSLFITERLSTLLYLWWPLLTNTRPTENELTIVNILRALLNDVITLAAYKQLRVNLYFLKILKRFHLI